MGRRSHTADGLVVDSVPFAVGRHYCGLFEGENCRAGNLILSGITDVLTRYLDWKTQRGFLFH